MKYLLLVLALLTSTATAHAETSPANLEPETEFYSTYFSFSVRGPNGVQTLDANPDARLAIELPRELAGWRCYRTPRYSAPKVAFENVACWHGDFTVGISVACRIDQESHDTKSFFLRAPGSVEVQISGGCMTAIDTARYDDGF